MPPLSVVNSSKRRHQCQLPHFTHIISARSISLLPPIYTPIIPYKLLVPFLLHPLFQFPPLSSICLPHTFIIIRARASIQHRHLLLPARSRPITFQLRRNGNGLVTSKAFPHVHHALLAFSIAVLQLLALCRESVDERRSEAVSGAVSVNHNAVGVLEAHGQGGAYTEVL